MRPTVHATSDKVFAALGRALTRLDEEKGWPLLQYVDVFASLLGVVDDIVRDTDEAPGWVTTLDPTLASEQYLTWLGQFVGVQMTDNLTEAERRARVLNAEGWERGTPEAIRKAAQIYLSGSKTVEIVERDTSPYHFHVRTYLIETADPDQVEAEITKQKPGGLQFTYAAFDGASYSQLSAGFATYNALDTAFGTYDNQTAWTP